MVGGALCERVCSWPWRCPLSQQLHEEQAIMALLMLLRNSERKENRQKPSENAVPSSPRDVESSVLYVAPCRIPARHCAPAALKTAQRWKRKRDFIADRKIQPLVTDGPASGV